MNELSLDFYGIAAILRCEDAAVFNELREDFKYFISDYAPAREIPISWELSLCEPPKSELPLGLASLRLRDYKVYDRGRLRRIVYDDNALAVYDYRARRGRIYCGDCRRLHELAYLAVLSRVGEELDLKGLHRIHALGFEHKGEAGLVLLPSGGGKSTLALELLKRTDIGIIADDTPLIGPDLRLHAFPLSWGFLPTADLSSIPKGMIRRFQRKHYGVKKLVDVDFFRSRISSGKPLRRLIIGSRHSGRPRLERASRPQALRALAVHLIAGHGIAQMSEYMLSLNLTRTFNLLDIAFARAALAWRVARRTQLCRLMLGPDARANAGFLEDLLRSGIEKDSPAGEPLGTANARR
ncbi:MAG: hypothetical protein A3J74_06725 [Elusimicrobia bacterium RIFCSPHIGHO2_02_FULL_57_9]|nr:MAG: hypothetical protein A3J74_06725 [Elusimicrobia bacterium RIFCSPHIGHO2_02_FULL_57_9]